MKPRMLLVLVLMIVVSLSLSFGHDGKCDDKSACCQKGTKASLVSDVKGKDANHCDVAKADKASMKKISGKTMDCCKEKTKASEAKNTKSAQEKTVDAKGTN